MRREPCPDPLPFVHAATFDTDEAAVVVGSGIEDDDWQVETTASCYRILDDPLVATGEPDALQPQELFERGPASDTVSWRLVFPALG